MRDFHIRNHSVHPVEGIDSFDSEIPESEMRAALDGIVREGLTTVALGVGILYLLLIPSHILVLPKGMAVLMGVLAFGTTVISFTLFCFLRRHSVSTAWAHPIAVGIAGLVLLNSLTHLYLTSYPAQTTNLMLLVLGAGTFFLSGHWLFMVIITTLAGWAIIAGSADVSIYSSSDWVHFGFGLAMAMLLSIVVHHVRIRSYRRIEGLRIRDGLLKDRLLAALATSEEMHRTEEHTRRELEAALKALQQSEQQFRMLVETMNEGLCVQDENRVKVYVNDKTCEMFGYSRDEIVGRSSYDFFDEVNRKVFEREAIRQRQGERRTYEIEVRAKDGRNVPTLMSSASIFDEEGHFKGVIEAITDISILKEAEEERKIYTSRLEQSNRELQDFAFVASHDLQEPLRKIQSFGERLKVGYGDTLDERGCDYIERMQNASMRMQDLIQALLSYSRVTTRAEPFAKIDLNRVVREVINDLEARIEQTEGRVEVGNLPSIEADPSQIRQLFQNLIGNALKFHRDEKPIVKVHAQPASDREWKIFVEDNGIGFDEKYLDRVFALFQRLHGRSEYEGTGMGLPICRKIAERHGGSITAKSTQGKGSTFIVTLPAKQLPTLTNPTR